MPLGNTRFRRTMLPMLVACTGACVLIVEVLAVRILAPYFGNTIYTFSSVLTIVLAALSIGYFTGGRLIDRFPSFQTFFSAIFSAGISILILHLLVTILLPSVGFRLNPLSGPLVLSTFLFGIPCIFLGLLSPMAVRLQKDLNTREGVGGTAGDIFCFSTIGSIVGSLLAGFVLIPTVGITSILLTIGIALMTLGLLGLFLSRRAISASRLLGFGVLLTLVISGETFARTPRKGLLFLHEGFYEQIAVFDGEWQGRPVRFLRQDRNFSSAKFLDAPITDLVFDYTKYFAVQKILQPKIKRALFLGAGAYTLPSLLLQEQPSSDIHVVEIEPALPDIARAYFDLPSDPHLQTHVSDARRFLHETKDSYDLIYGDAYASGFTVPPHLLTKEFFQQVRNRLSPDGIFIGNFFGNLTKTAPSFVMSAMHTFRSVFPNSTFFAVTDRDSLQPQHIAFVAQNTPSPADFCSPKLLHSSDSFISSLCGKVIDISPETLTAFTPFTDDYAPVEYLTGLTFKKMVRGT